MNTIEVHELCRSYGNGKTKAVREVSFSVKEGELFGLIGPDGAGKTSIFRMLTTLLLPDSGTATVAGHDIVKGYALIRKKVGYMPGRFSLYPDLTIAENLRFFATLFNTSIEENYALISDIYQQIEPFRDRRAGRLSGGMKQKLALCCALIHKPEILFLDEPTTGVDPVSRKEFWEMLARLRSGGITILVSTPYMDEASRCDRIALMQEGRLLSIDTPANIISSFPAPLFSIRSDQVRMPELLRTLEKIPGNRARYAAGEYAHAVFDPPHLHAQTIAGYLSGNGIQNPDVRRITPTIEDCFIHLLSK